MKCLILFILISIGGLFKQPKTLNAYNVVAADDTAAKLKAKRVAADKYLKQHDKALLLYAKVEGKKYALKIKNEEWPEVVESSFNVLKDARGKIMMILEIPFSQSGDWSITYTHYFDDDGNTYAYKKNINVFDDVKGGVVYGTQINYYRANHKLLSQSKSIRDKYGKKVIDTGHISMYDSWYKPTVYKNVEECLKGYGIAD
jgi:hypothetical protein